MADNVTLNTGSGGATLATDDIAGIQHQRVKIQYGVDGAATDVSDTNPLPIDDAGGSITVDNAALSVTGGGVESGAMRVTIANDSTGVLSVDDNGGSLTVDNAALAVTGGGVESGALRVTLANDSTGVLSIDDNGGSLTVDNAALAVTGGGVEASALRVTLANDSTGVLSIDDNGGSLTVDAASLPLPTGAATSANQTTANSSLSTIAGAVSGTEMQVDIVAALPAGTNAIGKLAANSGVDIGDVDVTSISAGANLIGDVGISGARTSGGTTLYKNIDVDETEDQVKASAGQVYWIHAINLASNVRYLKIYNATAATVVVGTTVPDLTFPIPTAGSANGAGFTLAIPNGIAFSTAITIAATTGVADADTGAPGANEVIVNLGYA
jgi:hypothetical protein